MTKRVATLILALGLIAVLPVASAKPTNEEVFGDWRAQCGTPEGGGSEVCHVYQNLVSRETKKEILHAMVLYTPKRKDPVLIVTLPLGVALRPGIQIKVDKAEPRRMIFETCTNIGCRAGLLLDSKVLNEFKTGAQAGVSFFNLRGKQLNVPLSLTGFTKAVGSLR